jgi:hypothetical protein
MVREMATNRSTARRSLPVTSGGIGAAGSVSRRGHSAVRDAAAGLEDDVVDAPLDLEEHRAAGDLGVAADAHLDAVDLLVLVGPEQR